MFFPLQTFQRGCQYLNRAQIFLDLDPFFRRVIQR
jgi:hypothetical protein